MDSAFPPETNYLRIPEMIETRGDWPGGHSSLSSTIPPTWTTILTPITSLSPVSRLLLFFLVFNLILVNFCFFRLASILHRDPVCRRPSPSLHNPTHLLIVLGSGGHTAEMFNILSQYQQLQLDWMHRTYVVSSGDGFSASKANEFEAELAMASKKNIKRIDEATAQISSASTYDIVTVHRARRVHQSLLTTPISSLQCLLDCIQVLRGNHPDLQHEGNGKSSSTPYPDLILTNGPGTGVIVILASVFLLFFGFTGPSVSLPRSKKVMKHASSLSTSAQDSDATSSIAAAASNGDKVTFASGQMRSVYIESWARVKTLSLSGRLLKPFVDRFLVQWPQLVEREGARSHVEFVGTLVA